MVYAYNGYYKIANALSNFDKKSEQQQQKQKSLSQYQLYRYNHEPISTKFLRRDIPPILILLFFLFLIIIILSQILVVHTSRYGSNYAAMQKVQDELKQMDESMETLLRNNVLPIDQWRLLFHIQIYLYRFEHLFNFFNVKYNKTNEYFNQTRIHLINNMNNVPDRLDKMINDDHYLSEQNRRNKTSYNHKRRKYCNEEPSQLSKYEKKDKSFI
jgi:hypothetical protein